MPRPGVENDKADDVKGGDRRLVDINPPNPPPKGGLIGDRGTGFDGIKSVPSLRLAALTGVRLPADGERFHRDLSAEGAVLGRKDGFLNLGNTIIGRAAFSEPGNVGVLVDGGFLGAVVIVGLSGCRGDFIVKGAEDSSLVPLLPKDCVEDHGAVPVGLCVPTGIG